MENYTVQVIIPVYNASKYLRRCLDSLKAQTFGDWQAILVDDGSKDNSAEIISEYTAMDDRFRYFKQNNSGVAVTRNNALDKLDAEYVAFLDSDDYWEADMLECLYSKAKECDADVVQCRYMYDYTSGKQEIPQGAFDKDVMLEGKELKKVYLRMMTGINMNHVCMKLIKTSVVGDLRFDTSLRTAEDLHFCVRLFRNVTRYCFINRALYHYCRNEDSLTGKGLSFTKKLQANRDVSREMAKSLSYWGIDTFCYRLLTYARPYTIIFSKIIRILKEKIS